MDPNPLASLQAITRGRAAHSPLFSTRLSIWTLRDVRDAVQKEIARGATEDQAVATIRWPNTKKMQSYDAQRETAVRRPYQQLPGALQ